ncbi:integrin beta-PS isoform X1 [Lucilia sericata]|uniref:integrin beta-PS isoform X1 n=1 Tax=Lucilia sericata TaxID=13632 RepID=UPI0018A7F7A0|nr:integrin beta-PS isoform X1 [Lucilia sericata]XP_037807559.1 integrin beta-PS isoform X1 [Lucilia sericata]
MITSSTKRLYTLALLAFVFTCCVFSVEAQLAGKLIQNPCVNKRTCHECIQTQSCAWCMQPDHGDKPRCFQHSYSNVCPEEFIWNPDTVQSFTINRELTRAGYAAGAAGGQMSYGGSYYANSSYSSSSSGSYSGSYGASGAAGAAGSFSGSDIVQISPQRVSLKLRINEVHSLNMRYSQAEDYPVDLYYLMDLSKSMEDDKEKLSALGDLLSETMRNITSNFRLGFGSFVDKVLMPYVSTIPKKLEHPCENCEAPYGYRNHMPLSTNTAEFTTEVKRAAVSGNLDAPEGGFDAIMQAIACRQQIGWREQARRLLVFSTDAGFHYAGDGKLGGVIAPNDGECHLNSAGLYTHSVIQDYPSISQINHKVKQNSINIIFAVTANQHSVYEKLSQHIEGSSSAILSNDSSNVVDLVREEYSKISSSIEMKDNATSHVKITYHSSCLNGGSEIPTSKCDGLKVGDIVNFTAQILVTSCPTDPAEWNQVIQIYPVGINESLVIDLEMLCSCPCEKPGSTGYQINSPVCNNHGTYMCGICECDDMHFGHNCECSTTDVHSEKGKDFGCRADNVTTIDCNGRGTCLCGVCDCEKRANPEEIISGRFCECDNFSCDRHEQQLCSGPDHGVCECGSCVCKPGWTGTACDCRDSNDTCIPPNGGEICSGHGECECGVCKCKSTEEGRYSGKYCEKCPTCSGRCHELKDCVQCQMYKTGPLKEDKDCAANCTTFVPIGVEKVELDEKKEENICIFYDEDDCKFAFKYSEEDDKVEVHAQQERECPPKVFMLGIVLGVIAAIVLVGLAILLLWKLLTTIHDRREFARFEKERMNARWDTGENPIYKQATSTFKNPTYAGK